MSRLQIDTSSPLNINTLAAFGCMRAAPARCVFNLLPSTNSLIPRQKESLPSLWQWRSICGAFAEAGGHSQEPFTLGPFLCCGVPFIMFNLIDHLKKKKLLHYIALSPEWDIWRLMHVGLLWISKPSLNWELRSSSNQIMLSGVTLHTLSCLNSRTVA